MSRHIFYRASNAQLVDVFTLRKGCSLYSWPDTHAQFYHFPATVKSRYERREALDLAAIWEPDELYRLHWKVRHAGRTSPDIRRALRLLPDLD